MKKSEINDESISKIKIELNTLFYLPGETITGTVKLYPEIKIKIKKNKIHLKLKLIQYEFWEYKDIKINELKNIHKTEVLINNIEYDLKEEEQTDYKENEKFENFSIILIEKEDKDKYISIPFEFILDKNKKKLLPTFQFEDDNYILGIRHLLVVECLEYNSVNHIGLFVGKQNDNNFNIPKNINKKYKTKYDEVDIDITFQKQNFYFGENINFTAKTKLKYTYKGTISYIQILDRKIKWKSYLKNSLLSKKIIINKKLECSKIKEKDINKEDDYLEYSDEFLCEMREVFSLMIYGFYKIALGWIAGGILGGLICPYKYIGIFVGGFSLAVIGEEKLNQNLNNYSPGCGNITLDFASKPQTKINNNNNEELKEELQKFVYFKDNKIIGFIKFKNDITPPVDGYYFKCDYNFKINFEMNDYYNNLSENIFKSKIDFYDGNEYIENMKKKLSVNSLI